MKVIATSGSEVYHTNPNCSFYPDEWREVTESDERRSISKCTYCRNEELEVLE